MVENMMNKQKVKIISFKDGVEVTETAILENLAEATTVGHNKPTLVQFSTNEHREGYFKDSSKTSKSFFDKIEYIICQIGKMLEIKMAETYKVYNTDGFCGIISESVFDKEQEHMYMTSQLIDLIKEPSDQFKRYIESYREILQGNVVEFKRNDGSVWKIPVIESEEDIKTVLEAFPRAIVELGQGEEQQAEIISDYYKMIMLDLITNNIDRNNNNYGIIIDQNGNVRFTPLFDNSTIHIPGQPNNGRRINGAMIDRDKLLIVLLKNHYKEIKSITEKCCDNTFEMLEYIRSLYNQELSEDEADYFLRTITDNIFAISGLERKKREGTLWVNNQQIRE
jgi:hypothetical protein